ncbi:hypothetical protein GCM10009841_32600 [Microlunatus panaciterrae]
MGPSSSTAAEPTPSRTPTPSPACPSGRYDLSSFKAKRDLPLPTGAAALRGSGDGLSLTFDSNRWTLAGKPDGSMQVRAGQMRGELTVSGTIEGTFVATGGGQADFRVSRSTGSAELSGPDFDYRLPMQQLALVVTPDGTARLACTGNRLTLDNEAITLQLSRDV